jgi:hypothetical protein
MLPAFGGPLLRVPRAVLQTSFVPPPFLGAFSKLREATISFVMSVSLSVRMEQLGYRWTNFY